MTPRSGESPKEKHMADEMPPPPAAPGQPDRRRPAPTIDLKATEIASEPDSAATTGARAHTEAGFGPKPSPFSPDEPQPEQDAAPPMPPPSAAQRSLSGLTAAMSWPLVGASLAGALLALGIAWLVMLGTGGGDSGPADARIAQLEHQVADLTGRAPAAAANSAAAADLADRVQKLEAQVAQAARATQGGARPATADPAQANRVAALETQLKSLGETVATLGQRTESSAAANTAALNELSQKLARPDTPGPESDEKSDANAALLAALANRVDALEGSAKTTETTLAAELAKRVAENADDRSVRTAVIAAALATAVERGRPFVAELQAAQQQAADPEMLAPLAPFAATGLPNANALVRELSSLEPALLRAAETAPPEGGFLAKLQSHAERLVRIRPIEEIAGDEPAAVIARVEIKAARGDLPGALLELDKLPPPLRAPAQPWIDKAQARATALAASRRFAADALTTLAKPSP
jgi:hypothetical protein